MGLISIWIGNRVILQILFSAITQGHFKGR